MSRAPEGPVVVGGNRQWLTGLGFGDWSRIGYVFSDTGWQEYSVRPALQEKGEDKRGGLYAIVVTEGFSYDDQATGARFYLTQRRPDGLRLPDLANKSKPGRWRRRSRSRAELEQRWVAGARLVYLGQTTRQTLKGRIQQLRSFALEIPDRWHTGGELLWQLSDYSERLDIGILPRPRFSDHLRGKTPLDAEKILLNEFRSDHQGKLPFANGRA